MTPRESLQRPTIVDPDAIPAELRELPHWVVWQYQRRDGDPKPTKVPFNPKAGTKAAVDDPGTWVTFAEALDVYQREWPETEASAAHQAGESRPDGQSRRSTAETSNGRRHAPLPRYSGAGIVLTKDMGLVGVDLDHVRDPETGQLEEWAAAIVAELRTYTEVSPSGTGLRLFVRGTLDHLKGRRRGPVELYSDGRYLTVTGHQLDGTPSEIRQAQAELDALHAEHVARPEPRIGEPRAGGGAPVDVTDAELLERMFASKNGAKIRRLWDGDTSAHEGDASAADLALVDHLAFWTDYDADRIDRLFRQSGLYRAKWDEARGDLTYGQLTIDRALAGHASGDGYRSRTRRGLTLFPGSKGGGDEGDERSIAFQELLERATAATRDDLPGILHDLHYLEDSGARNSQREIILKQLKDTTGVGLRALRSDFAAARGGDDDTERQTIAQQLLSLVFDAGVELWHDPDGEPHITIRLETHQEHHRLKTQAVKRYLQRLWYEETGATIGREPLSEALGVLEGKAIHDGEEHPVYLRVAETGDGPDTRVYLDMCDATRHVIEVTRDGWRIITSDATPVRFIRTAGMLALPTPQPGTLADLGRALGIPHERAGAPNRAFQGAVAWLLQACRVDGPFPILALFGEQGAGKSNFTRRLCGLLDPHSATLRVLSRDDRDILIAARNSWLQAKDNVSHLSQWTSDAFCRLATGGAISTRTLYTNDEETILNAKRPLLLNGITNFLEQQDLVDRALVVTLPTIPESERLPEAELARRYEEARPAALGALLDVVAAGIARSGERHLVRLPRMADFAEWIVACCPALGWDAEDFMTWYSGAKADLIREALDSSPLMPHVVTLVTEAHGEWSGTPSELLDALEDVAGLGDGKRRPHGWPKRAQGVTNELKRIAPALRTVEGIEALQTRAKTQRVWSLRSIGKPSSPSSPEPWTRPETRPGRHSSGDDAGSTRRHPVVTHRHHPGPGDDEVTMPPGLTSPGNARPGRQDDDGDDGDDALPTLRVGRANGTPRDLTDRAAALAQQLAGVDVDDLKRRATEALDALGAQAPDWWRSTAVTEPLAVAVALELIRADSRTGALHGKAAAYLKAARDAASSPQPQFPAQIGPSPVSEAS